jgi:hypothetical protein
MNTKSIIYAFGIALHAFAAVPGLAQPKLASRGKPSFSGRDQLFASSALNYYAMLEPKFSNDLGTIPFMHYLRDKDNSSGGDNVFNNKKIPKVVLPGAAPEGRFDIMSARVAFRRTSFRYPVKPGKDIGIEEYPAEQLMLYAISLKQFAIKNGYDTTYAFFSNMGMLNNKKRFFVVNLETMQVEQSGLVSQGRGRGPTRFDKQYSNTKESRCTSLGRYKIMNKYQGEYGAAYRVDGLDSSNSNAYKRHIVLHPMGCIPDEEQENMPVCVSEGCPAVSVNFLSSLSKIIESRKKPVLLWIFDSNLEQPVLEQKSGNKQQEPFKKEDRHDHQCALHRISEKKDKEL